MPGVKAHLHHYVLCGTPQLDVVSFKLTFELWTFELCAVSHTHTSTHTCIVMLFGIIVIAVISVQHWAVIF